MSKKSILVPIEVSARHVHLTRADTQKLFGKGKRLRKEHAISQSKQFLSKERVTLANTFFTMPDVGIVGPERTETQVELSATDARRLKISAKILTSGDFRNSSGDLVIHGPEGSVSLTRGVIIPRRHVHASAARAKKHGLEHGQVVSIDIQNPNGVRNVTLHDVVVRVHKEYGWTLHLDTDEGNAAGVTPKSKAYIIAS